MNTASIVPMDGVMQRVIPRLFLPDFRGAKRNAKKLENGHAVRGIFHDQGK